MKYLALDIGTYSIKSVLIKLDRKQTILLDANEFIYEELRNELDPDGDDRSLQRTLVRNIIPSDFEGKIIWQVPNDILTSRHLNLPVTQKKKVDLMIPFQLDENLPFSSANAHYFTQQVKRGNQTSALVNIVKNSQFKEYFDFFDAENSLPTYLTSELSNIHSYAKNKEIKGPVAILDIGHTTAKCYLIYDSEVVSHHYSFCAGYNIDEVISQTYQIPMNEAVIYKHQNCFLLTQGQYEEVSEDQREFATLMEKTMSPLVMELKRWLLGFRVKYGIPVDTLFLTGGTSNIHNIGNFFAQQVEIKTDFLPIGESLIDTKDLLTNGACSYVTSAMMGMNLTSRTKPGNFLHGSFSNGASLTLPLHSAGFIFQRGLIIFLILSALLGADFYFLSEREKSIDRKLSSILKRPETGLSARYARSFRTRGIEDIEDKVEQKKSSIKQEVSTLMASNTVSALNPLFELFNITSQNPEVDLINFQSDGVVSSGVFKAQKTAAIEKLHDLIPKGSLPNLKTTVKGNELSFEYGSRK